MSFRPDFSDSDDSFLSDDGDYYNFKERTKLLTNSLQNNFSTHVLSEEQKKEQTQKSFYSALCTGNKESIIKFLEDGIDIDINLQDEWTPVSLSVSFGDYEVTQELIKRGANTDVVRHGMTLLMMACNCPAETAPFEESYKIVKILIENGANARSINRKRINALMFAANAGNLSVVKYLFPLTDKNSVDNQRWTALFWAVNANAVDVVQYLLEEGLEYNCTDVRNQTPLDLAKNNNFLEIVNLLSQDNTDCLSNILNSYPSEYEEVISLQSSQCPKFFLDVSGMMSGVKCDSAVKILAEKNINLFSFLSATYKDLADWGLTLPYQRERIMGGLHKFHQYPFHPDSLHFVPLDLTFSNHDASVQLLSTIKQIIAMEASLCYIRKRYEFKDLDNDDQKIILENLRNIRNKVKLCITRNQRLTEKVENWDIQTRPVDLIKKDSVKYRLPWRKILFVSILTTTVIVSLRIRNKHLLSF